MILCIAALAASGCGAKGDAQRVVRMDMETKEDLGRKQSAYIDKTDVEIVELEDEAVALAASAPAIAADVDANASGAREKRCDKAVIDYSNCEGGYVMVAYTASTKKKLKALVDGPTTRYQYNLEPGEWTTLPLSDGNGGYKIGIYENVSGTSYYCLLSESMSVQMEDEFAPFLHSNQYVDYEAAPKTVKKAKQLCSKAKGTLKKVEKVYDFVVKNLKYDKKQAAAVKSGYLPDLDKVLAKKKGICFDYAALMTGMLRSQRVPCKLVIGYAGTAYHAWISVYTEKEGWIDGAIYFDGTSWQRMDPTFASSGKKSKSIMKYIGDGSNYAAKYFY